MIDSAMISGTHELSTSEVAARLEISDRHAGELMRTGAITGRRLPSGAWLTTVDAVERYQARHRRGRGRRLNPSTAWGVLWELSGLGGPWLPRATRTRVRDFIEAASADEILRAVANRTQAHRFTSERIDTHVRRDLVLTGVSAVHRLTRTRSRVRNVVMGYTSADKIAEHARQVGWAPHADGEHVLFELNLPVPYRELRMPKAVIAADLIHSADERDRALAISEMERVRADWLRSHSPRTH